MSSSFEVVSVPPPPPFLKNGLFVPTKALYRKARGHSPGQLYELTAPTLPSHFHSVPGLIPSSPVFGTAVATSANFVRLETPVPLPAETVLVQSGGGDLATLSGKDALAGVKKFASRELGAACAHLLRHEYDAADMHLRECANVWTPFEYYVVTATLLKLNNEVQNPSGALKELFSRASHQFGATSINPAIDAWSNSLSHYIRVRRHPYPAKNPLLFRESRFETDPFGFTPAY